MRVVAEAGNRIAEIGYMSQERETRIGSGDSGNHIVAGGFAVPAVAPNQRMV